VGLGERDTSYPRRSRAIVVIAILMIVTCHSRLDQQFPALLVTPIREAFGISDTQISLFQGTAFALMYAIAGPVFGRFVDSRNRRNLIIAGILFWSGMTVWSGYTTSYYQLVVARMGVGVGEAVLSPAAYSLIADYVEPRIRGRAIGIFMASHALGTGMSLMLGGLIVGELSGRTSVALPLLGDFAPWQAAFVIVGLPGLLTVLLMFLISEPIRREDGGGIAKAATGGSGEFWSYIGRHRVAFGSVLVSQVAIQFVGNAIVPWIPSTFQRSHGLPMETIGLITGIELIVASSIGFWLCGYLGDRSKAKGRPDARLAPLFVGEAIFIPAVIIWPLMPDPNLAFFFLGIQMLGHVIAIGTLPLVTQDIVPNRMRGQAVTLVLMLGTVLGWAAGPTVVAVFTDFVFQDDNALPYSIIAATVPMALLAVGVSWSGRRAYIRMYGELHAAEASPAVPGEALHAT
jgi:MFS family permease